MNLQSTRGVFPVVALSMMVLVAGPRIGRADVIQFTVSLPPATAEYMFGNECISALNRCEVGGTVSDIVKTSDTEMGGNEVVAVTATYSSEIFTDVGGHPGTFLGDLILPGTADFTYEGRDPGLNPLGTFTTDVTNFSFSGTLNGNSFSVIPNPAHPSTGSTTILETTFTPPIEFTVSSSIVLYADYSFNGGPDVPAPPRPGSLTMVPEPSTVTLWGSGLACMLALAVSRRKRAVASASRATAFIARAA